MDWKTLLRTLLFLLLVWSLCGTEAKGAFGASPAAPPASRGDAVCVPRRLWRWRETCPEYGPGTTAYRVAHIRLPDPLPQLPVVELKPDPEEDIVPFTYAYVQRLPLAVYRHPMEAKLGLPPVRVMLSGRQWVSVVGMVEYEGERWVQINKDEFVPADALVFGRPSSFQGVYLTDQPAYPFAWINRPVRPSRVPQGPPDPNVPLYRRYQLVTIYAKEFRPPQEMWYLIGPDQWVEQKNVSVVTVDPPPAGVRPGERWIEVDLFEQTLAAYEGERMVYATLISSGRVGATPTPPGFYRIWGKFALSKMSNPDVRDGSPIWYYLEDVPWVMYFHGAYALHAAYWHDAFGFTRSYGCVNLPPRDARWLFEWADVGTPVWVHITPPFPETGGP
ncbi:MAG: L,D-transpeptidase [Anaerolineae bacterium]|nr:L,D-transpeptidase [Anaerolineae bacterium]MCX8066544.1 L,D-transpeptidase [Anaerolineae bacterium]MDW7991905.1 L,D-transpeptidase [Anaerolineae bacterium]